MYNPGLHFHFTGIGGSGMSGLAAILLGMGFKVSGSDVSEGEVCQRLRELGAEIAIGHAANNLPSQASLLVYSSAIPQNNPELIEAYERKIPVIRRAEVLAELMRLKFGVAVAGSHGKTTTTSMTGAILEDAGLDPTVIIGGIVKSFGAGGRLGKGEYLVAESDESDRSFLLLKPTIAVVTNIDAEHMESYSSLQDLEDSFKRFVDSVPFYGLAVLCVDDRRLREFASSLNSRVLTYGFSPDAYIQAINLQFDKNSSSYDLVIDGQVIRRIDLPLPGKHLVSNSLAAIAVALEFGVEMDVVASALAGFAGVGRRLEVLYCNDDVTVIDDYGHHPTEIKASIRAVKDGWLKKSTGKLRVIFQPHRYTRTRDCFAEFLDAFEGADQLLISDIYSAGEAAIDGISAERLTKALNHDQASYVASLDDCILAMASGYESGDVILCLGAGSMGKYAQKLANHFCP